MSQDLRTVDPIADETVGYLSKAALLAALTAALSQVSIPLPGALPPFSLQVFGSFFAALVLGPLWGGLALSLYLLVGIAGVPVFSNGNAGLGYVLAGQGTGGFLVGFLVGAVVAGAVVHRRATPRRLAEVALPLQVGGLAAAVAVVYAIGVPWMALVTGLPLERAAVVMAPYVPLDLVKLGVAIAVVGRGDLLER